MAHGKNFCENCGAKLDADGNFCHSCGARIDDDTPAPFAGPTFDQPQKVAGVRYRNKWVALLLCIFLGFFGVHKFYEGKIIKGILYLCTMGFLLVGWFIDILTLFSKPNPYIVL